MTPATNPSQKETPLAYRAVRGGLWVAASSYWQIGVGFVANIFLTRILLPEDFGAIALSMFFAQLMRLQPRLGLGRAFAQQRESDGRSLGTYLTLEFLAAGLSLIIGVMAVPVLVWFNYGETVAWLSLILLVGGICESFMGIGSTILDKELHFAQASLIQGIAFPLSYLPAFWLALRGVGPWSLAAQTLVFNTLGALGIWFFLLRKWQLPSLEEWHFDRALARQFLHFGIAVGAVTLLGMLLTQLDNFYIGTFVDARELGFYDRAYRLAQWPVLLVNAILTRAAFFTYARLRDDRERLKRTTEMVIWLVINLSVPVLLGLFIAAPDLLTILYTAKWLPSTTYLRVLLIFSLMRPLMMNATTFFIAIGKPKLIVRYNLVQLGILTATGYFFTIWWGAFGTTFAVGIMLSVGLVLSYWQIFREIGINLFRLLFIPALIVLILIVGYWGITRYPLLDTWTLSFRVVSKGAYAVIGFTGLLLLLEPRTTLSRIIYIRQLIVQK